MTDQDVIQRAAIAKTLLDLGIVAKTSNEVTVLLRTNELIGTVCASVAAILGIGYRFSIETRDTPAIVQISESYAGDEGFRALFEMVQALPAGSVIVARCDDMPAMEKRLYQAKVTVETTV